ncbi:MAG: ribonuclease R family protein, partial [Phycisphaeraceae bacterium]
IMRAFGLAERFDEDVVTEARDAARKLDVEQADPDREDLRDLLICTIDPPDAKDYDDAISLRKLDAGQESDSAAWELGVHIADVAHFVDAGSALDREAYERGNSTYLPRKVVPMLPELLSNGVCSLQEGVDRFTRSCFLRYDKQGKVVGERFCRSIIKSAKRLTYLEAQALIDGDLREARRHAFGEAHYPREVIQQLQHMNELAKTIRGRRLDQGMIVLGLPEVNLIFDDAGRVVDAEPEDDAFTHTIIEMFMVEANEAAARLFSRLDVPMVRRIHPDPDAHDVSELRQFARVAGYNIPMRPNRKELQQLLDSVRGKPAQHAVHIAVLRTLSKAEYAPQPIGHFALASEHYTHFTSPIRRYPDFIVHRAIDAYLDAAAEFQLKGVPSKKQARRIAEALVHDDRVPDLDRLIEQGRHCSSTERNSEEAERELRKYLVLELMASKLGEDFAGTVSGVIGRGVFVQIDRYLVDGFVPVAELPGPRDERYKLNHTTGALVAQRSGKSIQIGDTFTVRVAKVELASRQMELVVVDTGGGPKQATKGKKTTAKPTDEGNGPPQGTGGGKGKTNTKPDEQGKKRPRRQPRGARKAHQESMRVKKTRGRRRGG